MPVRQVNAAIEKYGMTPQEMKAYGMQVPSDVSKGWDYAGYDQSMAFSSPQDLMLTAGSGAGGTPTYMAQQPTLWEKAKDKLKDMSNPFDSLLSSATSSDSSMPSFVYDDPGQGNMFKSAITAAGGTGGSLGFTQQQRELQAQLISQAEAQAEAARKRAQGGWGLV